MTLRGGLASQASAWWTRLSPRERVLIGVAVAALMAYATLALVVRPLVDARSTARVAIAQHGGALAALEAAPPPLTATSPARPVSAVVTETAPAFDLVIRRIEPEGDGARLVVEDADFAAVLLWIEALEREHGLRLTAIEMDRRPEPGVVSARLSLAGAS